VPYSKELYKKLVHEDKLCELLAMSDVPITDQFEVLIGLDSVAADSIGEDELPGLFLGKDAPMFGRANLMGSPYSFLNFYNGLLLGGLLEGSHGEQLDYELAGRLLGEEHDLTDAAYPFFRAAVLKRLNQPEAEIRAEFIRAFHYEIFLTLNSDISNELIDRGLNSPSAMLIAVNLVTQIPVPKFGEVTKILYPLIDSGDDDFAQEALKLGQLLIKTANDQKSGARGPIFGALEYATGRGIYLRAWNKLHHGEVPEEFVPAAQWMNEDLPENWKNVAALVSKTESLGEDCNRKEIDKDFESILKANKDW
jgi:hypothetical protein